ncbi:MAG: AMP-binding protein [Myxococcota bacterium]
MAHPYAPSVDTLVALLRHRGASSPDRVGYTFLTPAGGDSSALTAHDRTWGQLDRRARAVAAGLAAARPSVRGERALMMFDEGLEYLDALYGCMYADVLAVPVHPPDPRRLQRTLPRLLTVAKDAGVAFVLTTRALRDAIGPALGELGPVEWLCVDELDERAAERWVDPGVRADDIAYLQYTSGSTATPKGVMVSHRNLLHQLSDFDLGYDHTPDSVIVSWLPATHDLGLVYGRFMAPFIGCRCVFLSPTTFMQRPARWMEVMSRYRGTHSPSPNFGYEIAARKVEDPAALDLSSVRVLLNGAEPIRQESEELFVEVFAPAGLPRSAVTHAMGMSEATAKIMTEPPDRSPPKFAHIDGAAYERNQVVLVPRGAPNSRTVASNGFTSGDTVVAIVDPDTLARLPEGRVGEMWVKGGTVAQGYFRNSEATEATFRARTSDGDGPYLRTGDLAFVLDREVYLCGRLKDVIIIRGQNLHPQDLEWTVASAHPALRPNCAAAFGVPSEAGEQLVLVSEVYEEQALEPEAVFGAVRQALSEHGVAARAIVLLPARGLPKTSSGKIQRTLARKLFLGGALPTLHRWDASAALAPPPPPQDLLAKVLAATGRRRVAVLADHVRDLASALLGVSASDIDTDRPFGELGIDSVTAVEMVERLARELRLDLPGTILFDWPTIDRLSKHLVEDRLGDARPAPPKPAAGALTADRVAAMSDAEVELALLQALDDV